MAAGGEEIELDKALEEHKKMWDDHNYWTRPTTLTHISSTGHDINCQGRREFGWIAANERCSTGNYTQSILGDLIRRTQPGS